MQFIFGPGLLGAGGGLVFDWATDPPGQQLVTQEQQQAQALLVGGASGGGRRPRTTTRFKPRGFGPRVHLDTPPEDNWPAPPPAPVQEQARPPAGFSLAPRRSAPVLPARASMPPLMRPQAAPAAPAQTPGQAVNALLATLNELAMAAGLDQDAIESLAQVDAIDVSDVFNDMKG